MAFASREGFGFRVDPQPLAEVPGHEAALFAEQPAFVVEVADVEAYATLGARHGVRGYEAGIVLATPEAVIGDDRMELAALRDAWEAPLRDFYGVTA